MKEPFRAKQSEIAISNLMQPFQTNTYGNIHGGEIMKIMDNAAGLIAHRHSRTFVVTAKVDQMEFHIPINVGNLVICEGRLTYVGKHSMEVLVTLLVDDLDVDNPLRVAVTSYFTLVAIDKDGKPVTVPPLKVVTDEDKKLYEEGEARYLAYKETRKEKKI